MIGFCQCFTDIAKGNIHSTKMLTITDCPNVINVSLQESKHVTWISTTNKWNNTNTYTTSKWIIMTFSAERTSKEKAPAQDYSQEKRL